jgi:TolB-like protein/class 3 adenylate cyclase/Flp pilus assembly protein TadD
MAAEVKREIALEIAHVLFIDIVAYSKMATDDQRAAIAKLNQIVQSTDEYRTAESENRLLKIATGDGMALIFYHSPEDPVECALEISRAIKEQHSNLRLRMGVHSGPVSGVVDVNDRANVAGAGINMAQRVMDCGDAGHILLSKRVAEDLEQFKHWRPHLYHIGECEVKHGEKVAIVNLFTAELGNSERPQRLTRRSDRTDVSAVAADRAKSPKLRSPILLPLLLIGFMLFTLAVLAILFAPAILKQTRSRGLTSPPPVISALAAPEKSIAVLPFDNLSRDPDNAFFTEGVQDEILTDLAKVADLKVISRSSVMQYKSEVARDLRKIGRELSVAHLLEGSVQRAGNRVRVNAQLIDARNDAHLWAQTYDRDLADVFAIQSEIAKTIADQLQAKLSPQEKTAIERRPTTDITAFDLYSRAVSLMLSISFSAADRATLSRAAELLNQAVARDGGFLEAYCQLSAAHDQLYSIGGDHSPARLALAEAAVQAALRLRPDAGEAHVARAEHLYRGYLDYDGALAELEIARRTLPNDPRVFELTGYILRRRGRPDEALHSLQRALELDPRNFFTLQQIALSYQLLRSYKDEASVLDRALDIKPDDAGSKVARALIDFDSKADTRALHQAIASVAAKDPAAMPSIADSWFNCALAEHDLGAARDALAALGDNSFGMDISQFGEFRRSFGEALIARLAKDEAKTRQAFTAARAEQQKSVETQPDYGPALSVLGLIDAALGRKEQALQEGRRAVEMLPVEKDSVSGPAVIQYLAIIAAWVGEKDLALEQLATAVRLPNSLSYGQLKLLPYWDPLRGDPRFEKIVADLAPK